MGLRFIILLLLSLTFSLNANCQLSIDDVVEKYNEYQKSLPKVKLHLSFNQTKFIPGDTVYYSAYFLSEDLIGVAGRQLLDLHLVGPNGISLVHYKYAVKDGYGYNQLALPRNLEPGIYYIVSYSSWMRNFSRNFIFKKEIEVVGEKKLLVQNVPQFGIEGGKFIAEVPNKIVVSGSEPNKIIKLLTSNGQIVAKAEANKYGMTSFVVTPKVNDDYLLSTGDVKQNLPKPIINGYALSLNDISNEELNLKLYTPQSSSHINSDMLLLLTSRGSVLYSAKFKQSASGVTNLNIPKSNLPIGLSHIFLLDTSGKPLAERDFYVDKQSELGLSITLNKSTLLPREKVKVSFSLDSDGNDNIQNLTALVLNKSVFEEERVSIIDELNILTEIENDFIINRSDSNWQDLINQNLVVNNKKIDWDIILSGNAKAEKAFTSFMRMNGIAYINDSTSETVPVETNIVFYMQNSMWRYETPVLNGGEVWLMIPEQYGEDEIFYFAENYRGKLMEGLKIMWKNEEIKEFTPPLKVEESLMNDTYGEFALKNKLVNNSYSFFTDTDSANITSENDKNGKFEQRVFGADVEVNVQDYQIFPTMAEMIREIIPSVIHRGKNELGYVRVTLPQPMDLASDDPLYVVNGIATKDTRYFLSLKPADILKVKIVNSPRKLMPLGLLGKNGIILIQTQTGEERPPLSYNNIVDGQNKPLAFKNLNFAHEAKLNYPYFKSTIYWNPMVKVDGSGNGTIDFYLSDDVGEVLILLEGITKNGEPFSTTKSIRVNTIR